jgi:L-asparaginase/Glu-tRNA(Gln) amidotransferase subunit D
MIEHAPEMRGLVLSLYGTGNGPSHKAEFMRAIELAVKRDIAVVAVTQVRGGAAGGA